MPYALSRRTDPKTDSVQYCIIREDTGSTVPGGCHTERSDALRHLRALSMASAGEYKGLKTLTRKEVVVARYIFAGLGNKEVAHTLGLSDRTIASHVQNIYEKLRVDSRSSLIIKMLLLGLIHLEELPELVVMADRIRRNSN